MMLRALSILVLATLALMAQGQTFEEYLKLRKKYGISQAVGIPALETFVGKRTMEVRGVVKGSMSVGGKAVIMLDSGDNQSIQVQTDQAPDWLIGNVVEARLLIRAQRDSDMGELKAWLIGAATEADVAAIEEKERRRLEAKMRASKPPVKPAKTPTAKWNLPASEATVAYANFIKKQNRRLSDGEAYKIATGIVGFSIMYGVDARLIMAMVMCESGFNPGAVSSAGAVGLGQLMPGTAAGMGVSNSYDSIQNLYGTVRLIRGHLDKYTKGGDGFNGLILALAAYNAGSGSVRRYNGVPPYTQTQNYIRKVVTLYRSFVGK